MEVSSPLCSLHLLTLWLGPPVRDLSFAFKYKIQRKQEGDLGSRGEGSCLPVCLPLGRKRENKRNTGSVPREGVAGFTSLSLPCLRGNIYFPIIASALTYGIRSAEFACRSPNPTFILGLAREIMDVRAFAREPGLEF